MKITSLRHPLSRRWRILCVTAIGVAAGVDGAWAQASGGTLTQSGSTYTHTFVANGTFSFPTGSLNCQYWIVGGGGGGGGDWGGGGGGGGVVTGTFTATAGSYAVVVGAGGTAGVSDTRGGKGGDSSVFGVTAVGGGGGGTYAGGAGLPGGSGGGGSQNYPGAGAGTSGQGYGGGNGGNGAGGGGGGAGGVGGNSSSSSGGSGGAAKLINVGTTSYWVGGGGGGGGSGNPSADGNASGGGGATYAGSGGSGSSPTNGGNAVAGFGGGGGGGSSAWANGGSGGSGRVIIQYTLVLNSVSFSFGQTNLTFTGEPQGPTVTASDPNATYSISYAGVQGTSYGPTAVAPTACGTYSITATANGQYSGTGSVNFTISPPSSNSQMPATGGSVSQSGSTYTHTFTGNGTLTVPNGSLNCQYWIVGGGGGGGGDWGGGGGGGGVVTGTFTATAGSYAVVVGAGGTAGVSDTRGGKGGDSSVFGVTAVGGGGGGTYAGGAGLPGGSGGGGSQNYPGAGAGTSGQGYGGGNGGNGAGGGGGGAGGAGGNSSGSSGGSGGAAKLITVGTTSYWVGGGGGGGGSGNPSADGNASGGGGATYAGSGGSGSSPTNGGNAVAGFGGGGGGGSSAWANGGSGGSGRVIIQYTTPTTPIFLILDGDGQTTLAGQFNAKAFDVALWNNSGTQPIVGASITFTVQSGGGLMAPTNSGSGLAGTVSITTDADGTARAYYQQPASGGITSQIAASTTGAQLAFSSTSYVPSAPPSAPGWVHASTSTPTSITFSWANVTQVSGGAPIAGYNVYRNGTLVNTAGPQLGTTFTDSAVTAGTTYVYTVKAVDTAGLLSSATTLSVAAPNSSTSGTFDVYMPSL